MSVGSFSQYRYTTDTLPILDRQFTDTLPTHYRCYHDQLSVDLFYGGCRLMYRPISRSTVNWHIGRYVCRDSVEYLPSVDRESVDISAEWCFLSVDTGNTTRPIYRPTHDRQSDDTRPNLYRRSGRYVNQQSTEISADASIDTPRKTHDPINLLLDSLLSKLQCLAICRGEMFAALLQLRRPRVLVWMVIELGPATPKS